jgi:hypothetical protein
MNLCRLCDSFRLALCLGPYCLSAVVKLICSPRPFSILTHTKVEILYVNIIREFKCESKMPNLMKCPRIHDDEENLNKSIYHLLYTLFFSNNVRGVPHHGGGRRK